MRATANGVLTDDNYGNGTQQYTIGYAGSGSDIEVAPMPGDPKIVKHPFDVAGRLADEEERAALGLTW